MKYKKFFVPMLIIALLGSLLSLVTPLLIEFWRRSGTSINQYRIFIVAGIMALVLLLQLFTILIRENFAKDYNVSNFFSLIDDYLHMDYDKLQEKGSMNILERMIMVVNSSYSFMTGDYIQIWSNIIIVIVSLLLLWTINPLVAFIMFFMLPINYYGYKSLNKVLHKKSQLLQQTTGMGWQKVLSAIGEVDYVKQLGEYDNLNEFLKKPVDEIYSAIADVNKTARSISALFSGINTSVRTIALIYIVYLFTNNSTNPASLILFTLVLPIYFNSINMITNSNLNKRDYTVAKEFEAEMKAAREPDGNLKINTINEVEIKVDELYTPGGKITTSVNGKYSPGDIIWIKGESGRGKSTLAKTIVKFRPIDEIKFNGKRLKDISNESVRTNVEYLSQNVPIIQGNLRDNLFLSTDYTEEKENKLSNDPILKTILKDKTFDTEIFMNGTNLSGGEKQKIALLRALASDAPVLILDEISANIDKDSAAAIYERVKNGRENRITFIISHDDLPGEIANKEIIL